MTRAPAGAAIAATTVLIIALLTLTPALGSERESRWCILCGAHVLGDALLNIALFVPLGLGLALLGVRRRRTLAIALLATIGIELAQGFLLRGRFASVSDVVTNTIGALTGHWIAGHWRGFVLPPGRVAAHRGIGLLVGWLAIVGFSAWALTPPLREGSYRALLPEHRDSEGSGNAGLVRTAELYRTMDGHAELADSASIANALRDRQLLLFTRFAAPLPANDVIASVHRSGSSPVITLAHGGGLAMLTVHTPARFFLLHEPTIFTGPVVTLPRSRDSLVAIAGGVDGAEIRMFFLRDSAVAMDSRFPIVPALWPYLLIGHGPAPGFVLPFSALLNALLLAPAAFWLGSAAIGSTRERRWRWIFAAIATVGVALLIGYVGIPAVTRLVGTPIQIWLASVAAVVAGGAAAAAAARHAPRERSDPFPA